MEYICADFALDRNVTVSRRVAWDLVSAIPHAKCHAMLVNAATSSAIAYLFLLILIHLRCSRLHSHLLGNDYTFPLHYLRGFFTSLLFLAHLTEFGDSLMTPLEKIDLIVPISAIFAWLGELMLHSLIEKACRPRYLYLSAMLWLLTCVVRGLRLLVTIQSADGDIGTCLRVYATAVTMLLAMALFFIDLHTIYIEMGTKTYLIKEPVTQYISYQHTYAHVFSKATFWWLTPLLWAGYQEPLEIGDLGALPDEENTATQFTRFHCIYLHEKMKAAPNSKGLLWRCYFKFCWRKFMLGGIFKLFGDSMALVGPLGISIIIAYVAKMSSEASPKNSHNFVTVEEFFRNGYVMGTIIFIAAIFQGTLSQTSTHLVNVEGIHLKVALQGLIYHKAMKLCSWCIREEIDPKKVSVEKNHKTHDQSTGSFDIGTVTNLMADDVFNVMSYFWIGHYIWAIPLKIGVLIYLLYLKLGTSAVIGATVCILTMSPLQFLIGKTMSDNLKKVTVESDERLRKMNETLQGIKLIKLLAWESLHEERIQRTRRKELNFLNKDSCYWALMTFFTHASSILITLVTFGVYYWTENEPLTAEDVFAGLALFNQLTVPLFIFPVTVPIIINAIVSTRRIAEFLNLPEISEVIPVPVEQSKPTKGIPYQNCIQISRKMIFGLKNITEDEEQEDEGGFEVDSVQPSPSSELHSNAGDVVTINDGQFSWEVNEKPSITVHTLNIPKGKLTAVVGKIGSGKTSLISAILGEMHQIKGKVQWTNEISIAYVSQKPWLLNGTLRENILFGEPFRPKRYQRVISACALDPDLELLPGNDLTEVGEKGINLSGGQKQRIAMARAFYSTANVVILDDSLSALDYQVGQHVFENGIRRLLLRQHRTVILITHRLQLLSNAQQIITVDRGVIRSQGTLHQLEKIAPEWRNSFSQRSPDEQRSKTAKERWSLFRLVSRIGLQLRYRNTVHGSWTTDEETHVSPSAYRPLRKRPSSNYGSRYFNFAHDLPLPTDECEEELDVDRLIRRRNKAIATVWGDNGYGSNTRIHQAATRAKSLQTNPIKGRPMVIRQLSSPSMQHEMLCASLSVNNAPNTTDMQPGKVIRQIRTGSMKSVNGGLDGISTNRENGFLKRLISSSSIRSNSTFEEKTTVNRLLSSASIASEDFEDDDTIMAENEPENTFRNEEERTYGRIPKRVFWIYIKSGGVLASFGYLVSAIVWQISRVYTDYWLSKWTGENKTDAGITSKEVNQTEYYLIVYGIISIISVLLSSASNILGQYCGAVARRNLHDHMLRNLLRCPMRFFETTPIGRILNRFSTDMGMIDKKVATAIQRLLQFLFLCLSAILVSAAVTPWFLIIAIPICLVYYIVQKFYRCSSRELQRLDSLARSPVLSHFSETLEGLSTIRAFAQQCRFTHTMHRKLDVHTNAFLILNTSNRWLGISLDYLGGCIVLTAIFACLLTAEFHPNLATPALVGLAINYTLLVPVYLTWVVKFLADMEMYLSAVDRVQFYSEMPNENYRESAIKLTRNWPQNGEILFENVSIRYQEQKEPVIANLNLHIPAGQKIGICGRTGSGKSSLTLSLFGLVDVHGGTIKIDGVDVSKVSLQKLRAKLSIIPQDVIMFGGTVRDNLDPKGEYTDDQIWRALELAQIKDIVIDYLGGLEGEVREGGGNLSSGERQLLCLARASLQDASILIMDEATSSVDTATERAFLQAARMAFTDSTVVTVAHRLETILDCDRIIVLDRGQIVEDGTPIELRNRKDGIFVDMLRSSCD